MLMEQLLQIFLRNYGEEPFDFLLGAGDVVELARELGHTMQIPSEYQQELSELRAKLINHSDQAIIAGIREIVSEITDCDSNDPMAGRLVYNAFIFLSAFNIGCPRCSSGISEPVRNELLWLATCIADEWNRRGVKW